MEQQSSTLPLTRGERKLIEVLANPENRGKNVSELCAIAGVDRKVYYRGFKKDQFIKAYNETALSLVKQSVGPVINTFVDKAIGGSYKHGIAVLEMAGLYTPKQEIKQELTSDGNPFKIEVEFVRDNK